MKIIYKGYSPPTDKKGYAWLVADEYIPESFKLFSHFKEADAYYATLSNNHPLWLLQLKIQ